MGGEIHLRNRGIQWRNFSIVSFVILTSGRSCWRHRTGDSSCYLFVGVFYGAPKSKMWKPGGTKSLNVGPSGLHLVELRALQLNIEQFIISLSPANFSGKKLFMFTFCLVKTHHQTVQRIISSRGGEFKRISALRIALQICSISFVP